MSESPRPGPSRWWYLCGVIIWIGGCSGTLGIGLSRAADSVEQMQRIVVPGEADFQLEPGEYVGYYEPNSLVAGKTYDTADSVSGVRCGMTSVTTGGPVSILPTSSASYEFGAFSGAAMFELRIPSIGSYRLACEYAGGEPIVIALGKGVGVAIIPIIAIAMGFFVLGAAVIVMIFNRRQRAGG